MEYWLSVGLSFEVAARALQALKQKAPDFFRSRGAEAVYVGLG